MKSKIIISLLAVIIEFQITYPQNNTPDFYTIQFNTESTVIIDNVNDGKHHLIWGQFNSLLPSKEITTDTLSMDTLSNSKLTYKINMPQDVYLFIDNKIKLDLFLVPNDTLCIDLNLTDPSLFMQNVKFKGKCASTNQYLLKRANEIGVELNYRWNRASNPNLSFTTYEDTVDAIDNSELNYLNNYIKNNNLPGWYLNYERNKVNYHGAMLKMGLPNYREYVANKKIKTPGNYYNFLDNVKIDNKDAAAVYVYYLFLNSYFFNRFIPEKINKMKFNNERTKKILPIILQNANKLLSGEERDTFICFLCSEHLKDYEMIQYTDSIVHNSNYGIKNPKYLKFWEDYSKDISILNPGVKAPDFNLPDEKNEYINLTDFKGKVVLLNFWFPGCAPCEKEISFEKKLVEQFKNQNFCLINICLNTPQKDRWIKSLNTFDMAGVNLYATGNWENILRNSYFIDGFPHYTLIGADGKVVSNNPKRPSMGLSYDILKLVNK